MYRLKIHRNIEKQLARFPRKDQERIAETIRGLAENPRPVGSIQLRDVLYRIRVGEYRLLYAIFDKALVIVVVKTVRRSESTYEDIQSLIKRAQDLRDS